MSAHPVKSVQILAGHPNWIDSLRTEMETQPHKFLERNIHDLKDRFCLFYPLCHQQDTYQHLLSGKCRYYTTRLKGIGDPVLDEGNFIDKMSRERAGESLSIESNLDSRSKVMRPKELFFQKDAQKLSA